MANFDDVAIATATRDTIAATSFAPCSFFSHAAAVYEFGSRGWNVSQNVNTHESQTVINGHFYGVFSGIIAKFFSLTERDRSEKIKIHP